MTPLRYINPDAGIHVFFHGGRRWYNYKKEEGKTMNLSENFTELNLTMLLAGKKILDSLDKTGMTDDQIDAFRPGYLQWIILQKADKIFKQMKEGGRNTREQERLAQDIANYFSLKEKEKEALKDGDIHNQVSSMLNDTDLDIDGIVSGLEKEVFGRLLENMPIRISVHIIIDPKFALPTKGFFRKKSHAPEELDKLRLDMRTQFLNILGRQTVEKGVRERAAKEEERLREQRSQTAILKAAAEQGDAQAQFELSLKYAEGIGIDRDDSLAFEWCQKSARQGYAPAQFELGSMYTLGTGVAENSGSALEWFKKAAGQNHGEALYILGVMYETGDGVEKNIAEACRLYEQAARQGSANAQYSMGLYYEKGVCVPKDEALAAKWYEEAAGQGHSDAQRQIGFWYFSGRGVSKNDEKAAHWLLAAARQDDALCQRAIGNMYLGGIGVPKDPDEGEKWLSEAVKHGDMNAAATLGKHYVYEAAEVKEDYYHTYGLELLRKAAGQGVADAMYTLGKLYSAGRVVRMSLKFSDSTYNSVIVFRDINKAIMWTRRAAEQGHEKAASLLEDQIQVAQYLEQMERDKSYNPFVAVARAAEFGYAQAQCQLGIILASENDGKPEPRAAEGIEYLHKAADQNHVEAQYFLGLRYFAGYCVPKNAPEGEKWLLAAAGQGHVKAQAELGERYLYGNGIPQDVNKAVGLLTSAAEQGNAEAQCDLGYAYLKGWGVWKSQMTAVEWYLKAAEQGHAEAQCQIGIAYAAGHGVPKNPKKAREWLNKAAEQGNEKAVEFMREFKGLL